jgi:hypothetical protein
MLRKWMLSGVAVCMFVGAASARAQFQAGDWELTLGGTAANSADFNGATAAFSGSLGYFLNKEFEVGLRQQLGYSDLAGSGGSAWVGSTRAFADYHFDFNRWQPYVGGHVGYVYGDGVPDTWELGPEGGVKFFVNSTTFIQASVEYQWFTDSSDDEAFDNGQFVYGLQIGFRWK